MDDMLEAAQALHGLRSSLPSASTPLLDHLVGSLHDSFLEEPPQPISTAVPCHVNGHLSDSALYTTTQELPVTFSPGELQPQFLSRVSSLPIVDTSIRSISSLYESTKSSSKVVQYSAEVLENNLRPLSKYIQDNPVVREVDGFACRQLDRFQSTPHGALPAPHHDMCQLPRLPELDQSFLPPSEEHTPLVPSNLSYSTPIFSDQASRVPPSPNNPDPELPRYRSRWHQVTAGAVAVAGAGAAVLSEESMKSLRYCLEWLQYATHHLRSHMIEIQSWLSSIVPDRALNLFQPASQSLTFPPLVAIKRDIANVLRRVIDVVGRYAGNVLRGDARYNVRVFILSLPSRWASLHASTNGNTPDSFEAERVHAFAAEADDILCSIRSLFEQTITTAEDWLSALGRVPFASSLGLVPHHANAIVEPMVPCTIPQNLPRLCPPTECLPNSPMLSHEMANMSLSSQLSNSSSNNLMLQNGQISSNAILPGTCRPYHVDASPHGQKRRTVEDHNVVLVTIPNGQNSICSPIRSFGRQDSSSFTGPALCAELYDIPLNSLSGLESCDNVLPSSLKKRKKDA